MTAHLVKQQGPLAAVLRLLASHGPASRTELAGALGVSLATLTRQVQALSDRGLVIDTPVPADGPGRPVHLVSLAPRGAGIVGIKLTDAAAWGVMIDPTGQVLASDRRPLTDRTPQAVVDQTAELVEALSAQAGLPAAAVGVSLGASVMGDRVVRVAPFLGWHDVPLAEMLSAALAEHDLSRDEQRAVTASQRGGTHSAGGACGAVGATPGRATPIRVGNDVRALAYASAWYGAGRGVDPFALVTVGAGIGCGLVVRGQVVEGAHGAAGSVGHVPVQDDGPSCEAGHRGCARALAATSGVEELARQALGRAMSIDELARIDAAGDPRAAGVLDTAARALGTVVGTVVAVADPGLVVLSGETAHAFARHEAALREGMDRVRHWSVPAPTIRFSPFSFHDWARGAAATAIEAWALTVHSA